MEWNVAFSLRLMSSAIDYARRDNREWRLRVGVRESIAFEDQAVSAGSSEMKCSSQALGVQP
jgi:hypothetical protein